MHTTLQSRRYHADITFRIGSLHQAFDAFQILLRRSASSLRRTETQAKVRNTTSGSQRHQDITDAIITHFLCKDNILFKIVNIPGFRHLMDCQKRHFFEK